MSERARFEFIKARDGVAAATKFLRENVIATYRKAYLDPTRWGMYKRKLLSGYLDGKRVLREEGCVVMSEVDVRPATEEEIASPEERVLDRWDLR